MKPTNSIGTLLALTLITGGLAHSLAQENAKPSPEIEAKVTTAVKAAFPEVAVQGIKAETENGMSFYEVKFTSEGKKMDGDVTADGTLLETEEAAELASFPKPAQEALKKATKATKVAAFEINRKFATTEKDSTGGVKVTKLATPTVAYEADVEKNGKKGEVAVSADGSILESPAWAKSKGKHKEKADKD